MSTAIINLKVKTVEEKAVPPQNNQLGNMIVSDDDITEINGDTSLRGQHSVFSSAFAGQISGFVKPDTFCRHPEHALHERRSTPDPGAPQILQSCEYNRYHRRNRDYERALGQVKRDGTTSS